VTTVADGEEAWAALLTERYDLLLAITTCRACAALTSWPGCVTQV